LIQTGMNHTILIVGSEMLSPEIDWEDRGTCILFGDGCGVAILTRAQEGDRSQFYSGILGADGTGRDFFHKEWGGAVKRINHEILDSKEMFMKMQGQEMFKVAVRTLAKNAQTVLERANM